MSFSNKKVIIISFQSLNRENASGNAFHGYKLSEKYQAEGSLHSFIVSSKGKFNTAFPSKPVSFFSRYYLFLLNNLSNLLSIPTHIKRAIEEELFDIFCQSHLTSDITTLIATQPFLPRTFKKAKKLGIKIFFIPGNPEDNFISDIIKDESAKFNIKSKDAYTSPFRLKRYNQALNYIDNIIAITSVTEKTYKERSHKSKIYNVRGFIKQNLPAPKQKVSNKEFTVGYLSYSVLLKGLQYLIEAWIKADLKDAKLLIGGPIDPNVQKIINESYSHVKNIEYAGMVNDKADFFSRCDIFVQPSLIDGAPVVVHEAAFYQMPIILTENCGAKDFVKNNESGFVIPIRDSDSIKEKVLWCYNNKHRLDEMGQKNAALFNDFNVNNFILEVKNIIDTEIEKSSFTNS